MLSAPDIEELASLGRPARHRAGTVLFHEGDPADLVHLLHDGRAKVHVLAPSGREVLLAIKEPGDLLGELACLDDARRSATATALSDLYTTVVPASVFRAFTAAHPEFAMTILRGVSQQLRDTGADHVVRESGPVVARVAARLLALAERCGEHSGASLVVPLRLGHDDLASWTAATRESVSRAMAQLRGAGAITSRRGRIVVIDADLLRDHAASEPRSRAG